MLRYFKKKRGFTLIEVLISIALFGVLSIFVVGSYLTISSLQRTISARQQIASEERFALDTLGREITWAVAIPDCPVEGCDFIRFASRPRSDVAVRTIEYRIVGQNIMKAETKPFGVCQTAPDVDALFPSECYQKVFSDAVKISSLKFFVSNNEDGASQVVVTVAIKGTVTTGGKTVPLSLSSTFTPRFTQMATFLVNGGLPIPPQLYGSHGDCSPAPRAYCDNKGTFWLSDWYRSENVDDYHTYVCWGAICDLSAIGPLNTASGWFEVIHADTYFPAPQPQMLPPVPPRYVGPPACAGEYGTFYFFNLDGGIPIHMAIRAHRHVDDAWSQFSNIRSSVSLPRNPTPCVVGGATVPPPPPTTVPPATGAGRSGGGSGGEQ
jgi:prepilin-type N-terminal cleavage/methylation domain-containing protein